MKKGGSCPSCGYVIRKFAIRCPRCRSDLHPLSEEETKNALGKLAERYVRKMDAKQ